MKILWILSAVAMCIASVLEKVMTRRSRGMPIWYADVAMYWAFAAFLIAMFWIEGWKPGLLLLVCTVVLKAILDRILATLLR